MAGTSFESVREGDLVTVLYDRRDPTRAQLTRSGGPVILVGLAHCLVGVGLCVAAFSFSSSGGFGLVGG